MESDLLKLVFVVGAGSNLVEYTKLRIREKILTFNSNGFINK